VLAWVLVRMGVLCAVVWRIVARDEEEGILRRYEGAYICLSCPLKLLLHLRCVEGSILLQEAPLWVEGAGVSNPIRGLRSRSPYTRKPWNFRGGAISNLPC